MVLCGLEGVQRDLWPRKEDVVWCPRQVSTSFTRKALPGDRLGVFRGLLETRENPAVLRVCIGLAHVCVL